MYLKSLELQGFKSFPDKIRLTFDEGLTAVVGPNGSGKSNIGDAVRWVLGEQSTKELRGKSMEDVIFSGTKTRKPMGFAAVTLTIDNSDHALSDPEPEVAVTRRLYRSGDSEYLINGKNVRLRDVNELFMDTGLGRDGYAIIGQGRIAEIVGAKSNERRDIFEEAAGVSKFRYKKQEAQRKLSAAQDNLLRLTDIAAELESRIGPLKHQAEKAEKFVVLAEERKELELSVWVHKLKTLGETLETLSDSYLRLTAEYENLQNDIQREEEKLQLAFQDMQQATADIETLQDKIVAAEQSNADTTAKIAVCENEIRHSNENIASLTAQKEALALSDTEWEEKLRVQDAYLKQLEARQNTLDAEISAAETALSELEQQGTSQLEACDTQDAALRKLYLRQSEQRIRQQTLDAELKDTYDTIDRAKQDGISAKERLREYAVQQEKLSAQLTSLSEKQKEQLNRKAGFQELTGIRQKKYEQAVESLSEVSANLQQAVQKQKILRDLEQNMEGYAGSVRQVLKVAGSGRLGGVHGTVAQKITVQPQYGTAIETALGGALQNLIVENEDAAKRCIRYLKEIRGGRATFLPMTTIRGNRLRENLDGIDGFVALACDLVGFDEIYRNVMESLLGRIAVCDDIDSASRIAKEFGYRFRIVTLDGQVVHSGGSYTGGSAARSAGVITRTHEIEEAAARIQVLQQQQEQLRADAAKRKAEWEKLKTDVEGADARIAEYLESQHAIEQELSALQAKAEADAAWQENEAQQRVRLQNKAETLTEQLETLRTELETLENEIAEAEETLETSRTQRQKLSNDRAAKAEEIGIHRILQAELAKDIASEQNKRAEMVRSQEQSANQAEQLSMRIQQEKSNIVSKEHEISVLTQGQQSQREAVEGMQKQILSLRNLHEEKEKYTRVLREGTDALRDAREKQSAERTRVEERQNTVRKEMDDLIFRMQESYELTVTEAESQAKPIENLRETETALTSVKNKIRALGSVNVAAIDEYREVSERYTFLSAQLKDVEHSKQELEALIEKLTQDMCVIFTESFAQINQYFGEIFVELFGGGSASLELTDPEHVLESGIEIRVAPPGKVIRNLISLSGGEQSFIAICIYFAILKLRPAPFCILDEIDAALDEVNVRKYAQYLNRFLGETQFVVVTHRRSAMEEAHVLYGVTMQEDGVSRLLRLDQSGMAAAEQG